MSTEQAGSETTYLELSEAGGAHKFYEVSIAGTAVRVRYGRIGAAGATQDSAFDTREAATAFARKKLDEKRKKGYAEADARAAASAPAPAAVPASFSAAGPALVAPRGDRAPVLWEFATGAKGFGVFADARHCWVGNQAGAVFALDHDGQIHDRFQLPDGVRCLIADEEWRYAGCDDGNVYELGARGPRLAYRVDEGANLFALDVCDGALAVSDNAGGVTVFNHESERLWHAASEGRAGWMVRADDQAVYHGHAAGITAYARATGKLQWHQRTDGAVLFGWHEHDTLYVATSKRRVESYDTRGVAGTTFVCDATVYSCAAAPRGRYVFAADNCSWVYCFAPSGERLWKLRLAGESAYSMQYHDGRLFVVTTDGVLACLDASDAAIEAAQRGTVPTRRAVAAPPPESPAAARGRELERTHEATAGVVLECIREGGALRVRVVSPGYEAGWRCQFPRDVRVEGARYVVDAVRPARAGGFYRVVGEIKRLE